ncbi:hypothetical protein F4802DRAFT_596649 [Xylaria palmicola]|nr:hypothetical protein F4802DRAFT_596649 [Xylaria palmicola]
MPFRGHRPKMPDSRDFDGRHLLTLVRSDNSPFHDTWDVNLLIQEVEENLCARAIDIPCVPSGSNNYRLEGKRGFHLQLSNGMDVVARLARSDVNMLDYEGFPIHVQVPEVKFETEVYERLQSEPDILASRLLYYRVPVQA